MPHRHQMKLKRVVAPIWKMNSLWTDPLLRGFLFPQLLKRDPAVCCVCRYCKHLYPTAVPFGYNQPFLFPLLEKKQIWWEQRGVCKERWALCGCDQQDLFTTLTPTWPHCHVSNQQAVQMCVSFSFLHQIFPGRTHSYRLVFGSCHSLEDCNQGRALFPFC